MSAHLYYVLVLVRSRSTGDCVFVVKNRPENQRGRVNLPGGKVEKTDPTFGHAAAREMAEETGLAGCRPPDHVGMVAEWSPDLGVFYHIHCYRSYVESNSPIAPREGEDEEVFWSPWRRACEDPRLLPNLKTLVPLMSGAPPGWVAHDNNRDFGRRPYVVEVHYS